MNPIKIKLETLEYKLYKKIKRGDRTFLQIKNVLEKF